VRGDSLLKGGIRNFAKRLWMCGKWGCGQARLLGFDPVCEIAKVPIASDRG